MDLIHRRARFGTIARPNPTLARRPGLLNTLQPHLAERPDSLRGEVVNPWIVGTNVMILATAVFVAVLIIRLRLYRPTPPEGAAPRGAPASLDAEPRFTPGMLIGMALAGYAVGVFSAVVGQVAAARLVGGAETEGGASAQTLPQTAVTMGVTYALAVPLVMLLPAAFRALSTPERQPPSALAWRWQDWWKGVVAMALTLPLIVVLGAGAGWLVSLFAGEAPPPIAHDTLTQIAEPGAGAWVWVLIAAAVIGAPIVEEYIYRGALQEGLTDATGSPTAGVLASSAVFVAAHWSITTGPGLWAALGVLSGLSVAMGIAYSRTRSIIVPIVMHALFNAANIAFVFLR